VTLQAISEPKCDYKSPHDAFKASLGHEQKVSASICAIYELAVAEKDYATLSFLKWFLDEQVEEERNVGDILAKLEMVGDNRSGLYQIDQHAARRAEAAKA
jgi:ferritin